MNKFSKRLCALWQRLKPQVLPAGKRCAAWALCVAAQVVAALVAAWARHWFWPPSP